MRFGGSTDKPAPAGGKSADASPPRSASEEIAVAMIWAQAHDGIIGVNGDMPWYLPEDFAHFKGATMGAPVIMGRSTWQSLPEKSKPLPGRTNIVLSRNASFEANGALVVDDPAKALQLARQHARRGESSTIWIIGGGRIYAEFMPFAQKLEVTDIDLSIEGDTRAPSIPTDFQVSERNPVSGWMTSRTGLNYAFTTYLREGRAVSAAH